MKDCTTCKYGYEDERLGFPMCHHPKRFSEDCIDFNMHEEKEIKESEEPDKSLEEAANAYGEKHSNDCFDADVDKGCPFVIDAFKAGAKWMAEQGVTFTAPVDHYERFYLDTYDQEDEALRKLGLKVMDWAIVQIRKK